MEQWVIVKSLDQDLRPDTSETYYKCLVSEETLEERTNVKSHYSVGSTCLECGERVKSRNINRHIREKHHRKKEEPCLLCGHSYTRKEDKDLHLCRSDPILYPFKCFECNLRLISQKKLERHNKNCSKLCYRFKCPVCSSNFSSLRRIKIHKLENCNTAQIN